MFSEQYSKDRISYFLKARGKNKAGKGPVKLSELLIRTGKKYQYHTKHIFPVFSYGPVGVPSQILLGSTNNSLKNVGLSDFCNNKLYPMPQAPKF